MDEPKPYSFDIHQVMNRLAQYPCFHGIPEDSITSLITHQGTLLVFPPYAIIVEQDEWVDSIYVILSGKVEVSVKKPTQFKKNKYIPVAELHSGAVIGLNENGFYSLSGKRTATVTSIDCVHAIKIELKYLQTVFERFPQHHTLHHTAYQFLKLKLIKEALPFINLSHARLIELSNKIQDRVLEKDQILFNEGDMGNECYLIVEGEIAICRNNNGETKELVVLKSPAVFGEATLITLEPRNATAKAKTNCTLLEIKKSYLTELMESPQHIEEAFMTLMINRSCPIKSPQVEEYTETNNDYSHSTTIKQPKNQRYLKLSEEGTFIWNQMNGKNSLKDITINHCKQFKIFSPETVTGIISKLARSGFIENLNFSPPVEQNLTFTQKYIKKIMGFFTYQKSLKGANQWLAHQYTYIQFLYKKEMLLFLLFLALSGFIIFMYNSNHIIRLFEHKHIHIVFLALLLPLSLFSVTMHELGHAFTVKHYKRDVHFIGLSWNYFSPSAFTDTSDMWLAEKKQRTVVNLSGIFSDLILAGIAAWLITLVTFNTLQAILWLFCLYTYISAFKNLNPLAESDGYYILVDWLDKPKLKDTAIVWLGTAFKKKKRKKQIAPELIYWMVCLFFLFGVIIITLFVQNFFLKLLGLPQFNPISVLAIPILTMLMTALSAFKNRNKV